MSMLDNRGYSVKSRYQRLTELLNASSLAVEDIQRGLDCLSKTKVPSNI